MATKVKTANKSQQDLNRWCIEMAMKWPIISVGGYGNAGAYMANTPRHDSEADIISRANKIMSWVKEAH